MKRGLRFQPSIGFAASPSAATGQSRSLSHIVLSARFIRDYILGAVSGRFDEINPHLLIFVTWLFAFAQIFASSLTILLRRFVSEKTRCHLVPTGRRS